MENSYADDYFSLMKDLTSVTDANGDPLYQPNYGGAMASEMKWNAMQNQMTNFYNYAIAAKTNETNLQLAREQNQWNLEQWDRQNKYNEPAHQAQLLRDAGLSSAAAAQAVTGVPASPLQSADLANQQIGHPMTPAPYGANGFDKVLSTVGNIVGAARAVAALRKENVEAKNAEQTQDASIQSIITDSDAKQVALRQAQEDLHQSIITNPYHARSIAYKAKADSYLPEISRLTQEDLKLKLDTARENYGFLVKWHPKQLEQLQNEIDKGVQEIRESKSREQVNAATVGNIQQDTANKREQNKGIQLENFGKVVDNALKRAGAPDTSAGRVSALVTAGILPYSMVLDYLDTNKLYIESAGRKYSNSPELRGVFLHDIAPGSGRESAQPIWTKGSLFNLRGSLQDYIDDHPNPFFKSKR